jgi:hypothetical protein
MWGRIVAGGTLALSRGLPCARRQRGPRRSSCGSPSAETTGAMPAALPAARPPQCRTRPRALGVTITRSAYQAAPRQPRNIEKGGSRGAAFGGEEAGATTKLLKTRAEAAKAQGPATRRDGHGAEEAGATTKLLETAAEATGAQWPATRRDGHGGRRTSDALRQARRRPTMCHLCARSEMSPMYPV